MGEGDTGAGTPLGACNCDLGCLSLSLSLSMSLPLMLYVSQLLSELPSTTVVHCSLALS